MGVSLSSGREVNNSCPWSSQCFGDGYCPEACPETNYEVLKRSAKSEHDLDMLPHTDPDILAVCSEWECHRNDDENGVLSSRQNQILTTNEERQLKQRPPEFRPDYRLLDKEMK